jgi:hypothetical protein
MEVLENEACIMPQVKDVSWLWEYPDDPGLP